jgi:predicted DNA-binding mobile mystery protein A
VDSDNLEVVKKTERSNLARKALDARFADAQPLHLLDRPARGWIRAIRDALGMTARQLGDRLGTSQAAVTKLERSEVDGSIRLDSLRRAAAAMDATLVYAIVPRSTLEDTLHRRAEQLAWTDVASIHQTMRLEGQALTDAELETRVEAYAAKLVEEGRLWDQPVNDGP